MAIKDSYPAIRPSLNLNFAGSGMVDPRITFTRASSATYFDDKGMMRTALAGVPRIDHDPVTGECKRLLIEEARTNLLTYSEQFDNAAWIKNAATVTADATSAPSALSSADALIEDTTTAGHYLTRGGFGITTGSLYSVSVFLKPNGRGFAQIIMTGSGVGGTNNIAGFNLTTGATTTNVADGVATAQNVGGGWWRCILTVTAGTTGSAGIQIRTATTLTSSGAPYLGDGVSGVYLWGAQIEVGAFPTSYIKTEASQVTRAADTASMTGANFSDWANSVGTVLAKYKTAGWKHNNTPPVTQLDLTKAVDNYSTSLAGDSIERLMFYPRQLTADQIAALKV